MRNNPAEPINVYFPLMSSKEWLREATNKITTEGGSFLNLCCMSDYLEKYCKTECSIKESVAVCGNCPLHKAIISINSFIYNGK